MFDPEEIDHHAVDIGDDATLTCTVGGNPAPAIVWRRKGDEEGKILSSSNKLTLYNVRDTDIGAYTCSGSVIGYDSINKDVHLLKKGMPTQSHLCHFVIKSE